MHPHSRCTDTCRTTPAAGCTIKIDLVLSFYPLETAEIPKYVIAQIGSQQELKIPKRCLYVIQLQHESSSPVWLSSSSSSSSLPAASFLRVHQSHPVHVKENWGGVGRLLVEHRLCQCLGADWRGRLVRSHSSVWESCLFYQRHSSHTAADWPSTVMKDVIFMQQWSLHATVPPPPLQLRSVIAHLASVPLPTFLLSRCALSSNWCLSLQDRGSGHL